MSQFGPIDYAPGEAVGAPDHPHRGFETVTYSLQGTMQHLDSAGNSGNLGPGWVQWMTAGAGLVHSEMPSDDIIRDGGVVEGFQLWVNLPAKDKWLKPRYQDTPPEKIPVVPIPGTEAGTVKVIAGKALGTDAYIETRTPIYYLDVVLGKGDSVELDVPAAFNAFVYCRDGRGVVGADARAIKEGEIVVMEEDDGDFITLAAPDAPGKFLLLAGEPINEPVARHGPFVMNTREELMEAFDDYRAGRLGMIPGSEDRYEATRQARAAAQKSGTWQRAESEL